MYLEICEFKLYLHVQLEVKCTSQRYKTQTYLANLLIFQTNFSLRRIFVNKDKILKKRKLQAEKTRT